MLFGQPAHLLRLPTRSGCTLEWEDNGDSVGAFGSQVSSIQAAGGNVIPSFGGAAGGEMAQTCTSTSSLESVYANVVNTYHAGRLDFDIEGSVLNNTSANNRRDQALADGESAAKARVLQLESIFASPHRRPGDVQVEDAA